jgi:hypothetical protein
MIRDLTIQWRGPQAASPPSTTADATRPAGVSAGAWERELMIRETADAWKPKDADTRRGNALFCQVEPMPSPRVPTVNPSTVRSMDSATAQKIRDAAYQEYVADITSAWKTT